MISASASSANANATAKASGVRRRHQTRKYFNDA